MFFEVKLNIFLFYCRKPALFTAQKYTSLDFDPLSYSSIVQICVNPFFLSMPVIEIIKAHQVLGWKACQFL